MRKTPFRPNNEISQTYNDGLVTIYSTSNSAEPGRQAKEQLTPKFSLRFEEEALGINRLYLSRANKAEINRVIRVPRVDISSQDVAITHDGITYRIDTVQGVKGVWPASLDLALRRIENNFEVMPK